MLDNLANVAFRQGDEARARRLAEEALARQRDARVRLGGGGDPVILALVARDRGDAARAAALCRESLGLAWDHRDLQQRRRRRSTGSRSSPAEAGTDETAARLFGAAERLHELLGVAPDPAVHAGRDRALAAVRARLGEDAFAAAWAAGRAMPMEEAVAEAARVAVAPAAIPPRRPIDPAARPGLTPREREVLRLLVEGHTDREIAAALFVSPRTVGGHVSRILAKLGRRDPPRRPRAHALRHGLD